MTGMEHAIGRAPIVELAESFEGEGPVHDATVLMMKTWGEQEPSHGVSQHPASYVATFVDMARALADAGLLAPAPLREGGVGWYEVIHPSRATTHIAYVHEDGSIYFPEGTQVLDTHEFAFAAATGRAHRLVRADAVDRAEGDGRADQ